MTWHHVRAVGLPAPQGSKVWRPNGSMTESSAALAPWRNAVTYAAVGSAPCIDKGPIELMVDFLMPRPPSSPKSRLWPDKAPDLDKLLRGLGDSLTDAKVWRDDGQVCSIFARKMFAKPDQPTGAIVHWRSIEDAP